MAKKLHTEDDEPARKIGDRGPMLNWTDELGKSIKRDLDAAVDEFLKSGSRNLKTAAPEVNDKIKPVKAEQEEVDLKRDNAGKHIDYVPNHGWAAHQRGSLSELLLGADPVQPKIESVEDRAVGKLQSGERKTIHGNRGRNLTRLEMLIASGLLSLS